MGMFTQKDDVNFLLCERQFDFVGVARGTSRSPIGVIHFGGRSSMQALILCRSNIGGIRSNPEGYDGAYPAPRQCHISKLARTPGCALECGKTCFEGAWMLRKRLTAD